MKQAFILALFCFLGCLSHAQSLTDTIHGQVQDEWGRPLSGVNILSHEGQQGAVSDAEGRYSIAVNDGSQSLFFSAPGYLTREVEIGEGQLEVRLEPDAHRKDEIVQLGYSSQRRETLAGAVSRVSGDELEKSPVANLSQTFAGRLPGLITQETFSELSRANTDFFVRGISSARQTDPLVIVDGIPVSYQSNETLEYISANEIESVSVLKDASTQALYGIQGANGVIVVTTKRGRKGRLQITGRLDQSLQQTTTRPAFISAGEYAELKNQAALNSGSAPVYSEEQVTRFRSGDQPELYPNNNWYNYFMRDFASMQRLGVNMNAGNDRVQFFSNLNLMHQGGQFKTDQEEYNPAPNNYWVNYRSNVDMTLNPYLKGFLRLAGNIKREHTPGKGVADIYSSIFRLPPTMYGPLTPDGQVTTIDVVDEPTYGMLNRTGYINHTVTNTVSQFGLDLDMRFLTRGLNLSGIFAYQTNSVGSLRTIQDYERWIRTNPDELEFAKDGAALNTPLTYSKGHQYYYHLSYKTSLDYHREFGQHSIGAMAYMFYQNLTRANTDSPWLLPYNRVSTGVELNYGFLNRYFLKGVVGYSGSEQYARSHRYVATPAVAAAWVISNEAFLQDASWLSQLKLRASWGKTANDQSGLNRYAYLDNIEAVSGGPIGSLQYLVRERGLGNPAIQAEISTKQNLGLDLGLLGSLSLSVDVFKERMENMVVRASANIPKYQGVPLTDYPPVNAGVFENKGYEIVLDFRKSLSPDWSVFAGGNFSYAKNIVIDVGEPLSAENYAYRTRQQGYSYGQQFGYLVDYSNGNGFFNTQEELDSNPVAYGEDGPRLGDLRFRDLNGDGLLTEQDMAPIGYGAIPRMVYAFSGGLRYKSFDFSFLFQGLGRYTTLMSGPGIWETEFNGLFSSLHRNAWTQERYEAGEKISWPALSTARNTNHEMSDFISYDRSYLRLKNMEIAYTLPLQTARAISAEKIRIILSGQNLLTWDNMKTSDFGPEGGGYTAIPVYRVYSLGVNVIF